ATTQPASAAARRTGAGSRSPAAEATTAANAAGRDSAAGSVTAVGAGSTAAGGEESGATAAPSTTGVPSAAGAPRAKAAQPLPVAAPTPRPPPPPTSVLPTGVPPPLPRQYIGSPYVDQGVDYAAPGGTPLYAMGDGVIIGQGISGFGPNAPILRITSGPLKGIEGYYGHAGANLVQVGQHVSAGQRISQVGYGIVGISTGPHLEIGFYPPGQMGAGSQMLSLIGSLVSQHPGRSARAARIAVRSSNSHRSSRSRPGATVHAVSALASRASTSSKSSNAS